MSYTFWYVLESSTAGGASLEKDYWPKYSNPGHHLGHIATTKYAFNTLTAYYDTLPPPK